MRGPPLVLVVIAALAAGCLSEEPVDAAALAELPRTSEGFVVLAHFPPSDVAASRSYDYAFDVPAGLRFLDLDNHVRLSGGRAPAVRFSYATPSGAELAATAQDGSGLNGVEVADPEAGRWTLHLDGDRNSQAFRLEAWVYACEEGVECRVFRPPPDPHRHE